MEGYKTYSQANAAVAFYYPLFGRLVPGLARERKGDGSAMAASSVELAAFNTGRHMSLVLGR
jgi:hypothetical protein